MWMNVPGRQKHPEKYEDQIEVLYGGLDDGRRLGPIKSHKVDISKTAGSGTFGTGIIMQASRSAVRYDVGFC
jgi:hypothetical protein